MSFVDKVPFVSSIVYADSWLLDWQSQYTSHRVDSLGSQAYKHHRSESCCKSKQMNGLIWLPGPQSISLSSDLESPCTGPRQQIDPQFSAIVSLLWILVCKEWQVDSKPQQCGVWLMPLRVIHLAKQGSSLSLAVLKGCYHLILATSDLNWAENCQIWSVNFSTTLEQL